MSALFQFASKYQNSHARHVRIFVHGYLAANDAHERARLMEHVPGLQADEDAAFAFWDSGSVREVVLNSLKGAAWGLRFNKLGLALAAAKAVHGGVSHFNDKKKQALMLGNVFFTELTRFAQHYPQLQSVSLYGHSLGSRILVEALLAADGQPALKVDHLVLLGAARALDGPELEHILPALQGRVYNFYSRSDKVLQARPSLKKWAGRHPLPECSMPERVSNIELEVGHSGYWSELPAVFNHVHSESSRARSSHSPPQHAVY